MKNSIESNIIKWYPLRNNQNKLKNIKIVTIIIIICNHFNFIILTDSNKRKLLVKKEILLIMLVCYLNQLISIL